MHASSTAMVRDAILFLLVTALYPANNQAGWLDSEEGHGHGQSQVAELEEVDCKPDISDVIDYDPVTQTSARCEKLKRDRQRALERWTSDLAEAKRQLEDCQSGRGTRAPDCPPPPPCECPDQGSSVNTDTNINADDMFFFRLTHHLVNILHDEAKVPDSGSFAAQIGVRLSHHEWKKLQSYAEGKDYRKADIHDILVGMTMDAFYVNQTSMFEWLGEQINFKSPGIVLFLMSVVVFALVFGVGMYSDLYWNRRFLACLLLAIFVTSLIWNWIFLYQEETIKRYRKAQQYADIPPNCLPNKMTWSQSLSEWYRTTWTVQKDPCLDYHMMYLVDPLLDIPPSRALSYTISSFFVDPMKYIGRAFSEFHAELLQGLPLWAGCLALLSFYMVAFLVMYAFIAAPRRVRREQPRPAISARRREEQEQHRAVEGGYRQELQFGRQYPDDGMEERDYDDREGRRVENIARPPTLPPRPHEAQRSPRALGGQELPKGQMKSAAPLDDPKDNRLKLEARSHEAMRKGGNSPEEPSGGLQRRRQKASQGHPDHPVESKSHPAPSGFGLQDRSSELLPAAEKPVAVRPKDRHSGMHLPGADGDTSDISSLSSVETSGVQRPTRFPEGRSPRTKPSPTQTSFKRGTSFGSTDSGNVTAHPASEHSDVESLISSVAYTSSSNEPEEQDPVGGMEASALDHVSPVSVDSPSDFSIISQSPENTNSATYEFISTSTVGLIDGGEGSQSQTYQKDQHENDYDDDDFVVLKTETQ